MTNEITDDTLKLLLYNGFDNWAYPTGRLNIPEYICKISINEYRIDIVIYDTNGYTFNSHIAKIEDKICSQHNKFIVETSKIYLEHIKKEKSSAFFIKKNVSNNLLDTKLISSFTKLFEEMEEIISKNNLCHTIFIKIAI